MDGTFAYWDNLGHKLSRHNDPELVAGPLASDQEPEQPAGEDIANALQILSLRRESVTVEAPEIIRVTELLNSALHKMNRPRCIICEKQVERDVIADDGVCFECRNPECEPGTQPVLTPLQRGVLRVVRGYGDSTITQIHNRVNPVHDTALESQVAAAVVDLVTAKCLIRIGRWHFRLTDVGRNAIGR